jgi:hypothetical protein
MLQARFLAGALIAVSISLGACATNAPRGSAIAVGAPRPGTAQLVVYRPSAFIASMRSPDVEVNGAPTCDLTNGGSFLREIEPGPASVSLSHWDMPGTSQVSFQAEAGKTYYIRATVNDDKMAAGMFLGIVGMLAAEAASSDKGPYKLDLLNEAIARKELGATNVKLCDSGTALAKPETKSTAVSPASVAGNP